MLRGLRLTRRKFPLSFNCRPVADRNVLTLLQLIVLEKIITSQVPVTEHTRLFAATPPRLRSHNPADRGGKHPAEVQATGQPQPQVPRSFILDDNDMTSQRLLEKLRGFGVSQNMLDALEQVQSKQPSAATAQELWKVMAPLGLLVASAAFHKTIIDPNSVVSHLAEVRNLDNNSTWLTQCVEIGNFIVIDFNPKRSLILDVEKYLNEHLNNNYDNASMPLQERESTLDTLEKCVAHITDSQKRNVVYCYSCRGTGKTQFLKRFVVKKKPKAAEHGRVIACCCEKMKNADWIERCLAGDVTAGLCELVRYHVEYVTGQVQDKELYKTPADAYKRWRDETAKRFGIDAKADDEMRPLILLDTCEMLAERRHPRLTHTSTREKYTLLEALCLEVPAPESIFVIGCNAGINATTFVLTSANVNELSPLRPLTEEGHRLAVAKSWGVTIDEPVRVPLYHLAGGLPRVLRTAHQNPLQQVTLACGSWHAFANAFTAFKETAQSRYRISGANRKAAYACLLASTTKLPVELNTPIPMAPAGKAGGHKRWTFSDAEKSSIGAWDSTTKQFVVPPITVTDDVFAQTVPIKPSELHPFLKSDVIERFAQRSALLRGQTFERPFLSAVYARYLLARWSTKDDNAWVSLDQVLKGAIHETQEDAARKFEVNLKRGIVEQKRGGYQSASKEALTYFGERSITHHDAYLWCRKKSSVNVVHPMALRLRHGNPKLVGVLEEQLRQTRKTKSSKIHFPLLAVNSQETAPHKGHEEDILMVNADAMSSISWLWLIAPPSSGEASLPAPPTPGAKETLRKRPTQSKVDHKR